MYAVVSTHIPVYFLCRYTTYTNNNYCTSSIITKHVHYTSAYKLFYDYEFSDVKSTTRKSYEQNLFNIFNIFNE